MSSLSTLRSRLSVVSAFQLISRALFPFYPTKRLCLSLSFNSHSSYPSLTPSPPFFIHTHTHTHTPPLSVFPYRVADPLLPVIHLSHEWEGHGRASVSGAELKLEDSLIDGTVKLTSPRKRERAKLATTVLGLEAEPTPYNFCRWRTSMPIQAEPLLHVTFRQNPRFTNPKLKM